MPAGIGARSQRFTFDDEALVCAHPERIHLQVESFSIDREREVNVALLVEPERHAGQLRLYQRAVSVLAGLPLGSVTAEVVFIRRRQRVILPFLTA